VYISGYNLKKGKGMSEFKLLIVEDDPNEIENNYKPTIRRIEKEKDIQIKCKIVCSPEAAMNNLNGSYDGAIVDLKLDNSGDAKGNDVIREIHASYRIPVVVLTGTPNDAEERNFVKVFTRDDGVDAALGHLLEIFSTGLTKIMGGRGQIEDAMNRIFWDNITPHINTWVGHAKEGNTEGALLRHVVSHMQEMLEGDSLAYPQEMYVSPPMTTELRTGSILSHKNGHGFSIILSPPCDLAIRKDGTCKTDRLLICGIESFNEVRDKVLSEITKSSKRKARLEKLLKNNETDYYHWLPETSVFQGGVVNFRWANALSQAEFDAAFEMPTVQVASPFIKDLLARFSAYYARQGQPDFDVRRIAGELS